MPASIIRSMLSVPGISERFIDRAQSLPADVICFDLEDSVAPVEKPAARALVARSLGGFPAAGRLLVVRINGLDTGLAEADLEAVVGPDLHGINLPKVRDADDLRQLDHYLLFLERTRGIEPGSVAVIPWIESAEAVLNAYEICSASPRLIAVLMGGEDFTQDIGVHRTREGRELEYPRATVALAAHAAGIVPLDTPEQDYKDLAHFERSLQAVRAIGFGGKFCIHPSQVEVANRIFAPSDDDLAWARRVVDAYADHERRGLGAFDLDGHLIDRPVVLRARDLIAWHESLAAREAALRA